MISFALLLLCGLDFVYLSWWASKAVGRIFRIDDTDLPSKVGDPPTVPILLAIVFLVLLIGKAFWGFTDNPYVNAAHPPWMRAGDDYATFVILALAFAVGFSYRFVYLLGEIKAINRWRETAVYLEWVGQRRMEKSATSAQNSTSPEA